ILLGNGNGTLGTAVGYTVGFGPGSIALGDFNGDEKLDLAVSNYYSRNVSILLGNGNGTFGTVTTLSSLGGGTIAVGDFNGDGKLDFAVINSSDSTISIRL